MGSIWVSSVSGLPAFIYFKKKSQQLLQKHPNGSAQCLQLSWSIINPSLDQYQSFLSYNLLLCSCFYGDSRPIPGTAQAVIQSIYIALCIFTACTSTVACGAVPDSLLSPLPVLPKPSWFCAYSSHTDSTTPTPHLPENGGIVILKKWRHQEVE